MHSRCAAKINYWIHLETYWIAASIAELSGWCIQKAALWVHICSLKSLAEITQK